MPYGWTKSSAIIGLALGLACFGQAANAADDAKIGQDYLAAMAKRPGVVTLPSGVMYRIVSRSLGATNAPQPTVADNVTINYEGTLISGAVFDSSYARHEAANFPLGRLISAWQQVIPLMRVGDEIILYTPPSSAYGERDLGEIPPNSTLIFRVQLLGIGAN